MGDDEGVQVGKEGGARTNSELSVTWYLTCLPQPNVRTSVLSTLAVQARPLAPCEAHEKTHKDTDNFLVIVGDEPG
jgi:hypothetical protein